MTSLLKRILRSSLLGEHGGFCADQCDELPLERMEQWGYIVPSDLLDSLTCGEMHDVEIQHAISPITGEDLYFQTCECGMERIDPMVLRTWNTRIEKVMEETVVAMNIRGGITPVIPGILWRLGRKKSREFFYLRVFRTSERRQILSALRAVPKAVVLTGVEGSSLELQYDISHPCASLETIARLEEDGRFVIDPEILEDVLGEAAEMDDSNEALPKPRAKRGSRTAKIEKLVKEMEQHLRLAKEYARATGHNGNIELLPRPSLGELAERTGMSKMDISRCLGDPDAKLLKLLWEKALDIKQISR